MNQIFKNKNGFTMIEMIAAISIFAFTMVIVMGIFRSVIEGQRGAIASQNTQESMRFAFEVMSKEMRMAKKDDMNCRGGVGSNLIYNSDNGGTELNFKNKDDVCVSYFLENDTNGVSRLKISRGVNSGYITPDEIKASNLSFIVDDNIVSPKTNQAKVTMRMDVEAVGKEMHKNKITMQTTISSRNYPD